jgi:hypothetical protein
VKKSLMYKIALGLTVILIGMIACSPTKKSKAPALRDFGFNADVYRVSKEGGKLLFFVKTTLTNYTKDTIKFTTMSCECQGEYCVNNVAVKFYPSECFKNISEVIEVLPNKNFERELLLTSNIDPKELADNDLKIGFNFIRVEQLDDSLRKHNAERLIGSYHNKQHHFFPVDTSIQSIKSFDILDAWGNFKIVTTTVKETVIWSNSLDSSLRNKMP